MIASEMKIEAVFREKHIICRKRQFDENTSEEAILSAEELFKVCFIYIVNQTISSLKSRFEEFQN